MMVKDHSAALTKLRGTPGVTSTEMKPNAKHQATADRLSKLSGAEFDRGYMAAMVADHQEALDFLEAHSKSAESGAGNTSLAKTAKDMIPTVRQHLQQAQKIQKDLANNTINPQQPASKSSTSPNTNSNSGTTTPNNGTTPNSNRSGTPETATGGNR